MKTLVLGGYGNFGSRISRALAGNNGIDLWVGGRDLAKAQAFVKTVKGARAVAIDHTSPSLVEQLCALKVDLVIHTAGPFQGQDYSVARACAQAGAHYMDLADGRRFVADFPAALNADFASAHLVAISGASTLPSLSSAVVHSLAAGWQHIDTIDVCIAPAHRAGRGVATLASVLSYCGQDIRVWSQGQWTTVQGWMRPEPVSLMDMSSRRGAVCDVPDLELLTAHFEVRQRMMFRAALELAIAQTGFSMLAWLRKKNLWHRPLYWAHLLNLAAVFLDPWASDKGGMVVQITGVGDQGDVQQREWHLMAPNGHGPEIPCMPAILLARRLAAGEPMRSGAYTGMGWLDIREFAPEFAHWGIKTRVVADLDMNEGRSAMTFEGLRAAAGRMTTR